MKSSVTRDIPDNKGEVATGSEVHRPWLGELDPYEQIGNSTIKRIPTRDDKSKTPSSLI
ncbi:hypothetical protein PROFUN_03456 [Planoprotostelium fungivorum]|uniref:Uncharacterized protein n=1 Tax=Planoprotostelium fungivorum TaxID=1890364 RepID=A0A2P6MN84_9EUKA|nr:hypothetical protein PROFUN_03456 [Planoprotostelium fungivorum]